MPRERSPWRSRMSRRSDVMQVFGWATGAMLMMAVASGAVPEGFEERKVSVSEDGRAVEFRYRLMRPAAVEPGVVVFAIHEVHGAARHGAAAGEHGAMDVQAMVAPPAEGRRRRLAGVACRPRLRRAEREAVRDLPRA